MNLMRTINSKADFRIFFPVLFLLAGAIFNQAQTPPTQPILRIETGMHAAMINGIAVDAAGRFLVTASADKTARVWDLSNQKLLRVLRPPIGDDSEGKLYTAAISPDAATVAVGGWTGEEWDAANSIYLFDRESGILKQRITDLPNVINYLTFSPDGRFLAATIGSNSLRLYRTGDYAESSRDSDFGDISQAADFAPNSRQFVTSCSDGFVRLYAIDEKGGLRLSAKRKTRGGRLPASVKFSPDGERIAVGFLDKRNVDVLSGTDLDYLYSPDTKPYEISRFPVVGWSADGQKLFASGSHPAKSLDVMIIGMRIWNDRGRGSYRDVEAAPTEVSRAAALPDNKIVYTVGDGSWGIIDAFGKRTSFVEPTIANYIGIQNNFLLSPNADEVQFGYESFFKSPARFAVKERRLTSAVDKSTNLRPPVNQSRKIQLTDWFDTSTPKLNEHKLELEEREKTIHFTVAPNQESLLLGSNFYLRLYDRRGGQLWKVPVTVAWGVNISSDGRFATAALNDGTIRWYRMTDGKEILAFLPHIDRRRWVLWTPSGYYDASADGEELIGWHVNNGSSQAADFFPVSIFRAYYYRPDIISNILETGDETAAVKSANEKIKLHDPQLSIAKLLPPVVEINSLHRAPDTSGENVIVSYNVRTPSGEPVTGLKALIDGHPANLISQAKSKTGKDALEIKLKIPERECEISLIAENRYTKSIPAKMNLCTAAKH